MATLGAIAGGRSGFGLGLVKDYRYSEFGLMLIPLCVINWSRFLKGSGRARAVVLAGFWLALFGSFLDNWSDFEMYHWMSLRRQAGLGCVTRYYLNEGKDDCPMIFWSPLGARLEEARAARLSFYRKIEDRPGAR